MLSARFRRFLLVGLSNAFLHFSVLNICFSILGTSKIISSIIATFFAMTYSFILNRGFVFRSTQAIRKEVSAFILVTITGVLIIHNLVYALFIYILDHNFSIVNLLGETINYRVSTDSIVINVATVAGAVVAMIWNYNGYKRYVFVNPDIKEEFENQ